MCAPRNGASGWSCARAREETPTARVDKEQCATMLSVSDGANLWTANRIGAGPWTDVTRLRTGAILDGPESPTALPQVRNEFLTWHAVRGVELQMRSIHSHLDWVRREDVRGDVHLIGRWKEWVVNNLGVKRQAWLAGLPRFCRLRCAARTCGRRGSSGGGRGGKRVRIDC